MYALRIRIVVNKYSIHTILLGKTILLISQRLSNRITIPFPDPFVIITSQGVDCVRQHYFFYKRGKVFFEIVLYLSHFFFLFACRKQNSLSADKKQTLDLQPIIQQFVCPDLEKVDMQKYFFLCASRTVKCDWWEMKWEYHEENNFDIFLLFLSTF